MQIKIDVSCGELLDKLSILHIKSEKITDKEKLFNVNKELKLLTKKSLFLKKINEDKFLEFFNELININTELWSIEDELRKLEKNKDFGDSFIELARKVYFTNDSRYQLKNKINIYFGSDIVEEKDYINYK